ncbi:MAG: hypothetical protein HRU39_14595, partial [Salinicola sp.]|nr:hypothetical protein [Salinicola sp.]
VENVDIDALDFDRLLAFAKTESVGLTIVGPEAPLVEGLVDLFAAHGLPCFGPSKNAAQLEGSKAFTKDFLARHNIPTAAYANFTELEPALAYLREQGAPIVIKADGLAAGKGVIVAETLTQAEDAVRDMLSGNAFGDAGCQEQGSFHERMRDEVHQGNTGKACPHRQPHQAILGRCRSRQKLLGMPLKIGHGTPCQGSGQA